MTEEQMILMMQEAAMEAQWEDEERLMLTELHSGGKEIDPWG